MTAPPRVSPLKKNRVRWAWMASGAAAAAAGPGAHGGISQITLTNDFASLSAGNYLYEVSAFTPSASDAVISLLAVFYPSSGNATPDLTIDSTTGVITGAHTNAGSAQNGVFTPVPAPEPSGLALLALGAGGILARRQRRRVF